MTKTNNLKKQLAAAIAMVVVAALALGSATYAWFANNTTVSATGMSVKALSSGGLAIAAVTTDGKEPGDSAYKSSAAAVVDSQQLQLSPVSTATTENWYKGTASSVEKYNVNDEGYSAVAADDLDDYRLLSQFYIKNLDEENPTKAIYVSGITVELPSTTTHSTALNKSLRVGIRYNSKYYVFAPMYGAGDTVTFRCVGAGPAVTTYSSITKGTKGSVTSIGDATGTAASLNIYVYYEGEDDNCASVNAINIDTLKVSVSFSTIQPTI